MPLIRKTIIICLFFLSHISQATTYYVSTSGNNNNLGTAKDKSWRTIDHAVSKMVAGDTAYVRGGIYNEPPVFKRSGTASARINLLNAPGESPVIDCRNHDLNYPRFQNGTGYVNPIGYITIEGFEIRNCRHGMVMYNGHNLIVRRNWIHHSRAQGIHGNGKNILIDRNVINRNGTFTGCVKCNLEHGIYGTGPNWVITNNQIYDNLANGIVVAGYPRCVRSDCPYIKKYTDDSYGGASGWVIANNTIAYNNYRGAIVLWQPLTTKSKIINNIFFENSQKYPGDPNGVSFFSSPGGGHEIRNNICYATAPGSTTCIGANGKGLYTLSNLITANPNFVSAGSLLSGIPNFKLKAGSPAISKGLTVSASKVDFLGLPRGSVYDIGAFEFLTGTSALSAPQAPSGFQLRE